MKRKKKVIIIGIGIIVLLSSILSIVIYNANYNSIDIQQANKGWTIYDKSITNIKENMSIITEADGEFEWGSLKDFEIEVKGFRPIEEAIITSGGVSTKEINPKTMESKIVKGLYFAGEIIDVDSYTGGFNLQIAYSTGYTAGSN